MAEPFRGVFSIAQTPFSGTGDILWDDFEYECDWIVRAGAHGFVRKATLGADLLPAIREVVEYAPSDEARG